MKKISIEELPVRVFGEASDTVGGMKWSFWAVKIVSGQISSVIDGSNVEFTGEEV